MAAFGRLEVTLVCGEDLKDVDRFGKQDPYAIIILAGEKKRSLTHTDGGKNPQWHQVFRFENVSDREDLVIEVWDENVILKDKKIGTCRMSLRAVVEEGEVSTDIPVITAHGSLAGTVKVRLEFTSNAPVPPPGGFRSQRDQGHIPLPQPSKTPHVPLDQTVYIGPTNGKAAAAKPPPIFVQQAAPAPEAPAKPAYGYNSGYGYDQDVQSSQANSRLGGNYYS